MEVVALIALLGISLALIFGLPFGIAQYAYNFLKRKKVPVYWRWTALIPALGVLYLLASWILPEEHIYELDYKEIIAYKHPEGTTYFYGQSDQYGKHSGDFSFGIQTYPENYKAILDLLERRGFAKDSTTATPDTINTFLKENDTKIIQKLSLTRYSQYNYYADLLSDSSTIFMRKVPKKS